MNEIMNAFEQGLSSTNPWILALMVTGLIANGASLFFALGRVSKTTWWGLWVALVCYEVAIVASLIKGADNIAMGGTALQLCVTFGAWTFGSVLADCRER